VLTNVAQRLKLVKRPLDTDGRDRGALKGREQHPPQGPTERVAIPALEGFGDEPRVCLAPGARLDAHVPWLAQITPVLPDGFHLNLLEAWSAEGPNGERTRSFPGVHEETTGQPRWHRRVRRVGASGDGNRCAESA